MTVNEQNQQLVADTVSFARSYQLEALDMALKQNTIVFFETGTGKTLIAIMLLRSYAHFLRKPSPFIAVFLVPTVVLVTQQSGVVALHTDLKVGKYYGEMGVDFWDHATWKQELDKYEVLVMTPQILLNALRHTCIRLDQIKVLIFDECHNARGKHQYACIMTEFYHRARASESMQLPRVFGMTASPIKAKASSSAEAYWNQISELETLMHSKVYTCESDSVLTKYIPFSTPKLKLYCENDMPSTTFKTLEEDLQKLAEKHIFTLSRPSITPSVAKSAKERLKKLLSTLRFCLTELGIWLALKAAEVYSQEDKNALLWGGNLDIYGEKVVKAFSSEAVKILSAQLPTGPQWLIGNDLRENMTYGYLTSKIICLVETLLEYRELKDLRCIVFVQRIVTAIVIRSLLNELLPALTGWFTEYTAGHSSSFQSQSRKDQNVIVDKFRKGKVNIIIATSMLEEGLDVQSCNLVIRFDPSATICSFIQSRGRARMQNSDFVLMVRSDDHSALTRVNKYLSSGEMMRQECLSHANLPCKPIVKEMHGEPWYEVGCTGAIVTLSSSVALLHFYCSRLPSDRYFKPYPLCTIDKVLGSCTLQLPHGCPVRSITVSGTKSLKQLACLEACKELHRVHALTDNLVPDIVEEELEPQGFDYEPYFEERAKYFPQELIGSDSNELKTVYYCYLIELQPHFQYDVKPQNIVLAVQKILDTDLRDLSIDLDADRGKMSAHVKLVGRLELTPEQVTMCREFQVKLFNLLLKRHIDKLQEDDQPSRSKDSIVFNYLLIPALGLDIDWKCISSVLYPKIPSSIDHTKCSTIGVHTKNGLVCRCTIENSLVCTPHNGVLYCIIGTLDDVRGDTYFTPRDNESVTYKEYYEKKHGITLQHERENLLDGKHIFTVHNYLQRCRIPNKKDPSYSSCELPPELCSILMSPVSISTFYSFSFLPSVMHRIESLMLASYLKSIPMGHCMQNVEIPAIKVLEAITTKKCQEEIHLESLETLGDSFLKYAATQQLFKTHQSRHEGLLSLKRQRMISNDALCKLGCDRKIPGFIRNEPFDLKSWMIPGVDCGYDGLEEEQLSASRKVYNFGSRDIKSKRVADVAEALIGAFLSAAGEKAALSFMMWLGIEIDFVTIPYTRSFVMNPEDHVNIKHLESLLKYTFRDASLLVEALTHGSYMRPEIPGCYQRLEFLGDAVLDYLITVHLYHKYPRLSPGMLTDLRSASVNNDCYALSAIKAGLHKQVLHLSPDLHRHLAQSIDMSEEELRSLETFGWESDAALPKVLGDVIESLAGAIYIDSGHDKETVFRSMKPLLEPLVTIETLRLHPKRELNQLCQKEKYNMHKTVVSRREGLAYATVKVEALGRVYKETRSAKDWKLAERLACKDVLKSIKASMGGDASLLVEALTHGSYMRPEIPGCYQRLEFLGDAVLDYLITVHLYHKYPRLSPGMLTDLRSASVNNNCYALSAIKAGLHKQVLHRSPDLHRHLAQSIDMSEEELRSLETFGWESDAALPKVLGDVIESLAGAIYIDSGHDKETVFRSMKPLLDPLVTIETLRLHPKRELNQLCQKEKYNMHKTVVTWRERLAYATVKVEARGTVYKETRSAKDRKLAERLACKDVLKSIKASMGGGTKIDP